MLGLKRLASVAAIAAILPSVATAAFTDFTGLDGGGWSVDYQLHIDNQNNYNNVAVPYSVDNSGGIVAGSFDRVAYVLELQTPAGPNQYVFASFDAAGYQTSAGLLGVPTFASGEIYQQNVANLHVLAQNAPVTAGVFAGGGNIEFWPSNYGTGNANGVPGASNDLFDSGDSRDSGGTYGSMQVHNHNTGGANETLIAFNNWNSSSTSDLGVGNYTGNGQPDWTFSNGFGGTTPDYTLKDLQVLVHVVPEPSAVVLFALGATGLFAVARRRRKV